MRNTAACVFTIIGSVVGAGFLSGRELVRFFGTEGILPLVYAAFMLFSFFLGFLLKIGKKYDGFCGVLNAFPPRAVKVFKTALYISSYMSVSGMFAGFYQIFGSRILSLCMAVPAFFACKGGVKKINVVNTFFVPAALVYFAVSFLRGGIFSFGGMSEGTRLFFVLFYCGMNLFLALPLVCDLGASLKKNHITAAAATSVILSGFIFIILCAIRYTDGACDEEFPLSAVFGGGMIYKIMAAFGCFTSLVSAYYPLYILVRKKRANTVRVLLLLTAFAASFFGFSNIVGYIYPLIGGFGILSLIFAVLYEFFFRKRHEGIHSGGENT